MKDSKKIVVIGAGFAGLAAAAKLAQAGHDVHLIEKNDQTGGRARIWEKDGFTFDMGPSWYWMPEVFDNFFKEFGKKTADFYELKRLSPSYRVYFGANDFIDVPADFQALLDLFESIEEGSGEKLKKFLSVAEYKYKTGMNEFVWKPSDSITEFFDIRILKSIFKINMFGSVSNEVRALFKNPKLIQLLEFPVLFLGATPQNTPGLYSLMNYADLVLGTWFPKGGMHEIVKAMTKVAIEQGVQIHLNEEIIHIETQNGKAVKVISNQSEYTVDAVVSGADYAHTDLKLLDKNVANYDENYWDKKTFSPSSLLFYIGLNKKLKNVIHHNLFFDAPFDEHAYEIYTKPSWPKKPLFYASAASITDSACAPENGENLFFLIPLAPGLNDSEEMREKYFQMICERFEKITGENISDAILFKRSYAMNDFVKDYHSHKGNAYGLANTLLQTAFLKPKMRSKKLKNLFYTGQLTVPGPGVPPSIISGQVAAKETLNYLQQS
jgi:phytoene desaturase